MIDEHIKIELKMFNQTHKCVAEGVGSVGVVECSSFFFVQTVRLCIFKTGFYKFNIIIKILSWRVH